VTIESSDDSKSVSREKNLTIEVEEFDADFLYIFFRAHSDWMIFLSFVHTLIGRI
jgi:hypothetical protein